MVGYFVCAGGGSRRICIYSAKQEKSWAVGGVGTAEASFRLQISTEAALKTLGFLFFYCYYSINMEVLPNLNFAKFRGEADTSRHLSSLELGHLSKVRSFLCPVERRSFSLNLALAEVSEYHSPRDFCSCSRGTAGEKRVSLKRPMVLVVPLRQTRVKP